MQEAKVVDKELRERRAVKRSVLRVFQRQFDNERLMASGPFY